MAINWLIDLLSQIEILIKQYTANKLYFQNENIRSWLCLYHNFKFFSLANFWRSDWNWGEKVSNEILPKLIPFISDWLKSNSIRAASTRSAGLKSGYSGNEDIFKIVLKPKKDTFKPTRCIARYNQQTGTLVVPCSGFKSFLLNLIPELLTERFMIWPLKRLTKTDLSGVSVMSL